MTTVLENLAGAAFVGAMLVTAPLSRLWYNRWGASPQEVRKPLPGDERTPRPKLTYTRAITIDAPPAAVWPWLAQMGQTRGGLYSYDGLENIAGCAIHSADTINPEWALKPGDYIDYGPPGKGYPGQLVLEVIPEQTLITGFFDPKTREAAPGTLVYHLEALPGGKTRFLIRQRMVWEDSVRLNILWHIVEPVNFVMENKQMRGIKRRAERQQ